MRADDLRTRAETLREFVRHGSPRVLLAVALAAIASRVSLGPFGPADALVAAITLSLIGPFEWLVHRHLLHAPPDSIRSRRLGTGTGHVEHHRDPTQLQLLLLSWQDAAIFSIGLGGVVAAWTGPLALAIGASPLRLTSSAWVVAALGLLHYEWTHLLVHTRYRCRSRWYRGLAAHHRLHHYRNEHYWLGVTVRTGDRLAGTMPNRSDVELSPTARTLDSTALSSSG